MVSVFGSQSKIPQLDFCCCGFPLRIATLIIGWLALAAGVFALLICVGNGINPITGVRMGSRTTGTYRCERSDDKYVCILDSGSYSSSSYYGYGGRYIRMRTVSDSEIEHRAVVLMMLLAGAGLVLIAGVHMKKANYLVPFMVTMILAAVYGVLVVLLTIAGIETELTQLLHSFKEIGLLVVMVVAVLLDAYLLAVVNSYYTVLTKISYGTPPTVPPANVAFGVKSFESV